MSHRDHPVAPHHVRFAWILGVLGVLCYGTLFYLSPPVDGDAFDYADVAHNVVDHGELVQTHLRFPGVEELELPAPGGRRATLSAFLMVPLHALLGSSVLVVLLPFLLALLLMPRLALAALGPMFGAVPALLAAVAVFLHPRVLAHYAADPGVEPMMVDLVLVSVWAFRRERMIVAGIALGLATLVKVNAAMLGVTFLLVLLIHQRDRLRRASTWIGGLACVVVLLPYVGYLLWLSAQDKPFGEAAMLPYLSPEVIYAHIAHWFYVPDGPRPLANNGIAEWLTILWHSATKQVMGRNYMFGYEAGIPESIGFLVLPMMVVGARSAARRADSTLVWVFFGSLFLFHTCLAMLGNDVRNMLPLVILASAMGAAGVLRLVGDVVGPRLVVGVLLLESCVCLVDVMFMVTHDPAGQQDRYEELVQLKEAIPDDGRVLITNPLLSASYYLDRATVPVPLGPMTDVFRLAEQRDAGGLVIMRYRPGPCLPYDPAFRIDVDTEHFCVYLFDDAPRELAARVGPELASFEPMDHQFIFDFDAEKPALQNAYSVVSWREFPLGVGPLAVLAILGCLYVVCRTRRRWILVPGVLICAFVLPGLSFVVKAAGEERDESAHVIDDLPLDDRVLLTQVPREAVLRFKPLPLLAADGRSLCAVVPTDDGGAWSPLSDQECPPGVRHRRCAAWGRAELHGCPPWDGGRLGVDPVEAARLTRRLTAELDRLEARWVEGGREVVRLDRYLVVLP